MKRTLQYAFTLLLACVLALPAYPQKAVEQGRSVALRSQMELIHQQYGVNFVYDSSLDLDRIAGHAGNDVLKETDNDVIEKTVKDVLSSRHSRLDRESLEASLAALF